MILSPAKVGYGSDPELFFKQRGKIIGAEKIIPAKGMRATRNAGRPEIVLDGVQIELHPMAGPSTKILAQSLESAIIVLFHHLNTKFPDVEVVNNAMVWMTPEELESLDPKSRKLGCKPSKNVYGHRPLVCDVNTYLGRSPGGHLHFDLMKMPRIWDGGLGDTDERHQAIPLLDIFVGNTCVMFDRDLGQVERRVNYGRAGEYRDNKPYGLEYRTLSSFWLKAYPLVNLVFGMGNFAIAVLDCQMSGKAKLVDELVDIVKIDRFIEAIEKNDFYLARNNFERIIPFLQKHLPSAGFPLTNKNIDKFLKMSDVVNKKGLDYVFPESLETHWRKGWHEDFDVWLDRVSK